MTNKPKKKSGIIRKNKQKNREFYQPCLVTISYVPWLHGTVAKAQKVLVLQAGDPEFVSRR